MVVCCCKVIGLVHALVYLCVSECWIVRELRLVVASLELTVLQ